ncbi:uncharacterized protein TM35_000131590 [Trypanosoma theileri]|uniref:Uncharacterized protein n=1 Tax=Trypanosoma theileri TaxID=67003 RepID=A0A1X0NWT4_9TRYP|nr:uncharacterized protein TM35_000131590 [Trypanosoma theileri]ORC89155.1 hypothetical protein TM35_000131590 [Trypanosoma theileri]
MIRASLILYGGGLLRNGGRTKKGRSALTSVARAAAAATTTTTTGKSRKTKRNAAARKKEEEHEEGEEDSDMLHFTSSPPLYANEPHQNNSKSTATTFATPESFFAYKSRRSEEEVLKLAQRMQSRDLTGEVPVASFAYEVLRAHPSVRQMGLRERMAFLCDRWERLSKQQRQTYLDDPLKGLL